MDEHVCHATVNLWYGPFDLWCAEHNADKMVPLTDEQREYLASLPGMDDDV